MENAKGKGALDAFLNLLTLVSVGWFAMTLGKAFFLLFDKFFNPRIGGLQLEDQYGLKFAIASLIIVTPVLLATVNLLHRKYKKGEINHQSGIYRWLTYLMLFVVFLVIVGSLIALVFNLLNGDYTLATILKILTVLIIAGGIFGYYFYDLRRNDYIKPSAVSKVFLAAVIVLFAVSLVSSFLIMDTPAESRLRKLDQTRADHLTQLNQWIIYVYSQEKALPEDLNQDILSQIKDPKTGQPYEYRILGGKEYELCAAFDLKAERPGDYVPTGVEWYYHNAGRQCFSAKIDDVFLKQNAVPAPRID